MGEDNDLTKLRSDFVSAAEILRRMALGTDPATGMALDLDHLLQRPEVIRALMVALERLESRKETHGKPAPCRAGMAWERAEDTELEHLFTHGNSTADIAASLQRTTGAIRSRLLKLGLFDEFQVILDEAEEDRKR